MTIFREPYLETGLPDLVVVVWRKSVAENWASQRENLDTWDLRIMHFLYHQRCVREAELVEYFGRRALAGITRLFQAEMIRRVGSSWMPRAFSRTFAAVKIIAIEAKIGKWDKVLSQAVMNTWFASKSYVLMPRLPLEEQIAAAKQHGIGICSLIGPEAIEIGSPPSCLPKSYASWLFNDLAWRASRL